MKSRSALAAVMLMASVPARADPPKVAVFDLELVDTSLQGEVDGPRADEQRRLMGAGDQLRKALAESGKFAVLDVAPVNAAVATCATHNSSAPISRSRVWFKRFRTSF